MSIHAILTLEATNFVTEATTVVFKWVGGYQVRNTSGKSQNALLFDIFYHKEVSVVLRCRHESCKSSGFVYGTESVWAFKIKAFNQRILTKPADAALLSGSRGKRGVSLPPPTTADPPGFQPSNTDSRPQMLESVWKTQTQKRPRGLLRPPLLKNKNVLAVILTWSGGVTGSGGGRRCVRRVWLELPGQLTSAAPAQQQVELRRRSALTHPSAGGDAALGLAAAVCSHAQHPPFFFFFFFRSTHPLLWRRKLRSSLTRK